MQNTHTQSNSKWARTSRQFESVYERVNAKSVRMLVGWLAWWVACNWTQVNQKVLKWNGQAHPPIHPSTHIRRVKLEIEILSVHTPTDRPKQLNWIESKNGGGGGGGSSTMAARAHVSWTCVLPVSVSACASNINSNKLEMIIKEYSVCWLVENGWMDQFYCRQQLFVCLGPQCPVNVSGSGRTEPRHVCFNQPLTIVWHANALLDRLVDWAQARTNRWTNQCLPAWLPASIASPWPSSLVSTGLGPICVCIRMLTRSFRVPFLLLNFKF